jgi:coenzyme F420-0:L-glutamate ligase / coenzyme F420-1:gamma-L-glutamate ligase
MTAGTSPVTTSPLSTLPVTLTPLVGFPQVHEGDDVADLLLTVLASNGIRLIDGDILVISSKVVSKALGLRAPAAEQPAVVLSQTVRIVAERMAPSGVTRIVESVAGPVMTAAGVDASNTADQSTVLLLPHDPDAVAAQILDALQTGWARRSGTSPATGVILSDTAGRPWRNGQTDFALGASGVRVMEDLRGSVDTDGRPLAVTERCIADEICAAADLVKGKATGVPVAHVRGLGQYVQSGGPASGARDLVRTGLLDWFGYGSVEAVRAALGVEPGSAEAATAGIPPMSPETPQDTAGRAVRVALLHCPGVLAEVDGDTISLVAPDEFTLGVVGTRAVVALLGEGLTAALTRSPVAATRPPGSDPRPSARIVFSRTSRPSVTY